MPSIQGEIVVPGEVESIYQLAKDFPAFVAYMPDVNSIKVVERGEDYTLTAWDVAVMGRPFRWTERDDFDDEHSIIRYRQIAGDLSKFEGEWYFNRVDQGVCVRLSVHFELGIPMLAALLNPVLVKAVQSNTDQLLQALSERAIRL